MIKTTDEMEQEILKTDNIFDMTASNKESFRSEPLTDYLKNLLESKGMKAADAIKGSNLDRSYGHQIISGKKTPSRDKLIALAFGMRLSLDELNDLMKVSGNRTLYARDERDAVIIYGVANNMSLDDTNSALFEKALEPIA